MGDSYPRTAPPQWDHVRVIPLLPVYPPPFLPPPPELPSPPRSPALDTNASYILSTHIVPAAYLRTTPHVAIPPGPPGGANKSDRRQFWVKTRDELLQIRRSAAAQKQSGELQGCERLFWNCINRYVRRNLDDSPRPRGITLFFAHANGFPKEIWEPTLQHLLSSPAGQLIDEVWSWESIQHGDSALLNADNLGALFDCRDNTRDILNFLLHYIPTIPSCAVLPTHLPRVSDAETKSRQHNGFRSRKLVVVGHSYGGCTLTLAALTYPRLFSSLILVDPIIVRPSYFEECEDTHLAALALGALQRRHDWPSMEEALRLFSRNPYFSTWDPTALRIYVECALTGDPRGGVKLKMPGMQEAAVFSECDTHYEVWQRLEDLDPNIEIRWILPGKPGTPELGGEGATAARVWRRPSNSSNVRIPTAGHLIPQEAPRELAEDIRGFLQRKYESERAHL